MGSSNKRKGDSQAGKRVRDSPCSHFCEWHKNTKLLSYSLYVGNLGQTLTGSLIFARPYEPWSDDSVGCVLMVSLSPLVNPSSLHLNRTLEAVPNVCLCGSAFVQFEMKEPRSSFSLKRNSQNKTSFIFYSLSTKINKWYKWFFHWL